MAQNNSQFITIDDAYQINKVVGNLTAKSTKQDFALAVWSLGRINIAYTHPSIECTIAAHLRTAQFARKQAEKAAAIQLITEYVKSVTK